MTRQLEAARTADERERLLRMVAIHSPQSWGHFNLLGEYDFSKEKLQNNTSVLPPKSTPWIIPENWGPPTRSLEPRRAFRLLHLAKLVSVTPHSPVAASLLCSAAGYHSPHFAIPVSAIPLGPVSPKQSARNATRIA